VQSSETSARTAATAATLTATLGLATASWVVAVRQMTGMGMGVAVYMPGTDRANPRTPKEEGR
jgi:hypothetical protein